jgi:hypothetical protein
MAERELNMTTTFFGDRGLSLALVIVIMFAISLGQTGISYTMAFGALRALLPRDRSGIATFLTILRFGLVAPMAVPWTLRRKHALFQLIVVANALCADEPWDFLFPREAARCYTMTAGFPVTPTICSLPSQRASRLARPTLCRLPDGPRC